MEFALTADQKMMQESIGRTLERAVSLDAVRKGASAFEPLKELGVPGILIPEADGGLGLTLLDAALVAEQLGRHVAPMPFVASAVMAPLALRGTPWLAKLAGGDIKAGVAVSEQASGARDGAGISVKNRKLSGTAMFALDAEGTDIFVVADKFGDLHLVAAKDVEIAPLPTIDVTRTVAKLDLHDVEAEPLKGASVERMIDAGRIILAADTLGAGERMLEKAVAYAKERKQFGRVIASFQAVKHMCAEMAAELEPCRALVWYAAYAFDAAPERSHRLAAHAKAHTSEVGPFVARTATEVHGGMGFTDLVGLHYWFKRIGFNRQILGGPERARDDAARAQGWVGN
ncbi:MAG TPA: acyl-CoA dehydrogenase family protein [Rhizomicrobium sp.]|jgi:alkylation response protein AidB-like acyl-CoA dehydrogenase|nr:acyl-CoA dehydrogenase family protein [Rhizomicrobium sp.]